MKLLGTLTLALVFSVSAYAGNMQNGVADPPPTQVQTTETITSTVTDFILTVASILGF